MRPGAAAGLLEGRAGPPEKQPEGVGTIRNRKLKQSTDMHCWPSH